MSSEKKPRTESEIRKSKPTDQEVPPKTSIHEQQKPVQKGKVTKSHKSIQ